MCSIEVSFILIFFYSSFIILELNGISVVIFCRFLTCWHKTEVPDDASHKNCPLMAPPMQASCERLQMCVKPRKCIFLIKCWRHFRVVHMRPANKMLLSRHQIMHDSLSSYTLCTVAAICWHVHPQLLWRSPCSNTHVYLF